MYNKEGTEGASSCLTQSRSYFPPKDDCTPASPPQEGAWGGCPYMGSLLEEQQLESPQAQQKSMRWHHGVHRHTCSTCQVFILKCSTPPTADHTEFLS